VATAKAMMNSDEIRELLFILRGTSFPTISDVGELAEGRQV
jgi:hypothetical protein